MQLQKPNSGKSPTLRLSNFDEPWKQITLGEISGNPMYGMNAPATIYDGKNIYLRITDIDDSTGSLKRTDLTSPGAELSDVYLLKTKDLLFTRTGASTGKTYLYQENDGQVYFAGFLIKFSISKADPKFVYYSTLTSQYWKWVKTVSMRSGQPGINAQEYSKYRFYIPTLPEQEKISSFLSSVDEWIENLRLQKKSLENYKKGMLQKLFSQEIRFKDEDGKNYPEWDENKLGDFLITELREVTKPTHIYKSIGIRSHFKGTFQRLDADPSKIAMEKLFEVKESDLIINITFAWEGAVAIATKEDEKGLVSHRFPTFTFNTEITTPDFFKHIFPTKKFKYILTNISPGGAGRNRVLNKKDFLKIKVSLPTLPEQRKIADFINAMENMLALKANQIKLAEQWKKGLMQKMFI